MEKHRRLCTITTVIIILVISTIGLFLIYRFDNKYTHLSTQPINGVLMLSKQDLEKNSVFYLIRDWHFYPGVILSPKDLQKKNINLYSKYIYIGQYAKMNFATSTYDCASYRLTISLPDEINTYCLKIPEIFSAYKLYINDKLVAKMGELNEKDYKEAIQSKIITFPASGQIELLLAVSNSSGLNSGLIYPPAFGRSENIIAIHDIKLLIHSCAMLLAICAAVISIYFSVRTHNYVGILFSISCFIFIGITSYPFIHTFFETTYQPWYTIEVTSHYILLLLAVLIQNKLYNINLKVSIISAIPCVISVILALICCVNAHSLSNEMLNLFSSVSFLIKLYTSIYLIAISFYAIVKQKKYSTMLMSSSLILALTMLFDRLFPNYEPIYGGWFAEIGSGILIGSFACTLWFGLIEGYRLKLSLELHNQQIENQLTMQKEHYNQLSEQIEFAHKSAHDLRHHLRILASYANSGELSNLQEYLKDYASHSEENNIITYSNNHVANAVLSYYTSAAEKINAKCSIELNLRDDFIFPDNELCVLLANLLENSVEACKRQNNADERYIYLNGQSNGNRLGLVIENSFDGVLKIKDEHHYYSSKRNSYGIGINSVTSIVNKYNGTMDISAKANIFKVSILLTSTTYKKCDK